MDKHWALQHKVGISLPVQPERGYTASRKSQSGPEHFGVLLWKCKEVK